MKRFLTTTALALAMGTAAMAGTQSEMDWSAEIERSADQFFGSDLIGMRIYRVEKDFENGAEIVAGTNRDWDDIGEVNDLVISRDGEIEAVVLGIGGFLGIGERDVAIRMDAIRVLQEKDDADDRFLVINATPQQLETVPAFDRDAPAEEKNMTKAESDASGMAKSTAGEALGQVEQAAQKARAEVEQTVDKTGAEMAEMVMATKAAMVRPQVERPGYDEVEMTEARAMTADQLQGARVYGENDEDVGEISELLIRNGEVTGAVIDVGGFLGIGEKPVGVAFEKLQILKNDESEEIRVYIDAVHETLEAQPNHQGSS